MNFEVIKTALEEGILDISHYRPDIDEISNLLTVPFVLGTIESRTTKILGEGAFSVVYDASDVQVEIDGKTLEVYLEQLYRVHAVIHEILEALTPHIRRESSKTERDELEETHHRTIEELLAIMRSGRRAAKVAELTKTLSSVQKNLTPHLLEPRELVRNIYEILKDVEPIDDYIPTKSAIRIETPCRDPKQLLEKLTCAETNLPHGARNIEYIPFKKDEVVALPSYIAAGTIGTFLNTLQEETEVFVLVRGTFVRDIPEIARETQAEEWLMKKSVKKSVKNNVKKSVKSVLEKLYVPPKKSELERKRVPGYTHGYRESYTIMEKGEPLFSLLKNKEDLYSIIFDVIHGVYIAQGRYEFSHNDIHAGNLLAVSHDGSQRSYHFIDETGAPRHVVVSKQRLIAKIIDYGSARLRVKGKKNDFILVSQHRDLFNFNGGDYIPEYDILMLIGPGLFVRNGEIEPESLMGIITPGDYRELFRIVTEVKLTKTTFEGIHKELEEFYNTYRPKHEFQKAVSPINHGRILQALIEKMENLKDAPVFQNNTVIEIEPPRIWNPAHPIYYGDAGRAVGSFDDLINHLQDGKAQRYQSAKTQDWGASWFSIYRGTPEEMGKKLGGEESHSTVHIALIDMAELQKSKGSYSFSTECCGSDPIDFLRQNYGVAINGTFFDSKAEYTPIRGYSQQKSPKGALHNKRYETKGSLGYESDFAFVEISSDGKVVEILKKKKGDASYFESAPLLAYPGVPRDVLSKHLNDTIRVPGVGNVYKYRCENLGFMKPVIKKGKKIYVKSKNGPYAPYCGTIEPGSLSHAQNPNPRSMLALIGNVTKNVPRYIAFIVADAERNATVRDSTGETGMTLTDLMKLSELIGAEKAINLDGGGSSNICWSFPSKDGERVTYCTSHSNFYPVGNLLALSDS